MASAFVQQAQGVVLSASSGATSAFASGQTAGNLNWVVISALAAPTSVTDTTGNTYAQCTDHSPFTAASTAVYSWWYAKNIGSASAGANSVTAHFSASQAAIAIYAAEYSGLDTSAPFDKSIVNDQATPGAGTNAVTSTTLTPASQPGMMVALSENDTGGAAPTAGTGFTGRTKVWTIVSVPAATPEDLRLTATSAKAATFTVASGQGSSEHTTIAAFFLEPAGSASGSAAITEGADTAAGTGTNAVSATAAITEGADTVAGVGTDAVSGTAAITEGADAVAASGTAAALGSASITEGADTASGTGTNAVNGAAAILEGADSVAATGTNESDGTAAITEGLDTVTASGTAGSTESDGAAAITEGADSIFGTGTASSIVVTVLDPLPIPRRAKRNTDWQSLSRSEIEKLRRVERKLRKLRDGQSQGPRGKAFFVSRLATKISEQEVAPAPADRMTPVRNALRASRERAETEIDDDEFSELAALEYGERLRAIDALLEIVRTTLQ